MVVKCSMIPYWKKISDHFHDISSDDQTLLVYMDEIYYTAMLSWLQDEYGVVTIKWTDGPCIEFANMEDLVRFKLSWA